MLAISVPIEQYPHRSSSLFIHKLVRMKRELSFMLWLSNTEYETGNTSINNIINKAGF